ncbi:MAG: hypothetical protein JXB04_12295 [Kiritimatiellae bacterium]|nr:hypothetical protein [Kiritimatiellia bacterium]
MPTHSESDVPQNAEVFVSLGGGPEIRQPALFRCCPLGVQFYSPRNVKPYRVLQVRLALTPAGKLPDEVDCAGVVVHCEKMNGSDMFRVWVYFLDLPAPVRDHLHCLARRSETLCPFCENF